MARDPETAKQRPNHSGRESTSGREMRGANVDPSSMGSSKPPNPSLNTSTRDGGVNPSVTPTTQFGGLNPTETRPGREGGGDVRDDRAHDRTFRCADVGNADCRWEVSGRTADELLPQIEAHAREQHGQELDERSKSRILDAIRERRAA